jgi:subtilisin family serine protease
LAPDVELYSIRVLGSGLTGREEAFAAGVGWAIEHEMDVVNLSLGTGARKFFGVFHQIADLAYFRNVTLVAAIANVNGPCYPAEYASVISVAAHDDRDPARFLYNPRPPVEFGAPGIDIDVAWVGGGRMRVTGNSFAAPHIAAYAALIRSKHPDLRPFQIKTILHSVADNRTPV